MKKVKSFIIFFICLNSVNLFCQDVVEDVDEFKEIKELIESIYEKQTLAESQPEEQTEDQPAQQTQTVEQIQPVLYAEEVQNITLLTSETVNLIQMSGKNLNQLNFYLSKPFKMVINEQYDPPRVEIQNGSLIMPYSEQPRTILFTGDKPGRLQGFPVSGSMDVFEVVFQADGRAVSLKFKKNEQNYFELFSAVVDTRPYTLYSDTDIIKLAINLIGPYSYIEPSYTLASGSRLVEGKGSLGKAVIIAYVKRQNPSIDDNFLNKLIDTYIEEAAFENIKHDIAIAQMLYATSFLKGNNFVSSHNYGGLSELPNWNGKFANMTDGVRAHIQHIKGYVSTTTNNQQIVDPRYYLLVDLKYLGTVKTFDQLYGKWVSPSASADYKKSIEVILIGLSKR
jgi:hypothetical protein